MEHLGQYDLNCDLKNGVNMCCDEESFVKEINTTSIEYAVKVLLMDLGEDINREGIIKTPLRVAKALCDGTRGDYPFLHILLTDNYCIKDLKGFLSRYLKGFLGKRV